jgi:hypothetical protein
MSEKQFEPGDRVTYWTRFKTEKGIVKSLSDDNHVFVVYHCADEWDRYQEHTAARTSIYYLVRGWLDE